MSQAPQWSIQFNIQDKALEGFTQEAKTAGVDVLHWCLMNGKIPQEDYLKWAARKFELPTVKTDFFMSPPDLTLWKKNRAMGSWHQGFVPLTEWDGHLFIGCLEPPSTELKLTKPYKLVLASARHLFMLWDQFNPSSSNIETPAATAPISDEKETPETQAPAPLELAQEATAAEVVSFDSAPETPPTETTAPLEMVTSADDSPADFSREMPSEDLERTVLQAPIESSTNDQQGTQTAKIPIDESTDVTANTNTGTAVAVQGPRPLEACISKADLGAIVLSHALTLFEGAMLLVLEGNALKPWLYSDLFRSDKNKEASTIETETPSIFRIVLRTRLPYHGYVSPSPTNDIFFSAYYNGNLPKHATLVPVITENEIFGILMGISHRDVEYKSSLIQMERLADEMAQHLIRLKQSKAA